ncbi:carboxy terminal-processing peptidase [Larkinella punicea]|jgi:carboxyl-terminal processing protease|uniref:Tail-specific protease n=1 Tax=Larkinella punicea TaxID=2315727 RepID=A0A368JE47_9BACT|nr:carboxy terminal-processing peptidase [Larkinella punicea]RCR65927.1 tail-specific protease [Larkinella punicea]
MRKYLITLVPVLMLSLQPGPQAGMSAVPLPPPSADDLKPSVSQEHVEQLVARLLTTHHYRKVRLNDSLSSVVFDNYLKELDGNKAYFLASDVNSFEKYRNNIDDQLINGELTAAYDIYNVFRKRYQERNKFVQENFVKPFDFTVDETFNTDREKANWPKSIEEQNDLWRKLLKNQSLELKLTGKADTSVVNSMKSRYKNLDRYMNRIKAEDVFQIYMNSFAESLDPHTNYMSPRSADRFNQEMSASLEGIGALLQEDGDYIKISDIVPGGPAFKSKLLTKGDKIVGVAQGEGGQIVNIVGYQVDDAVKLIKGPKGTTVRLQIQSNDAIAGAPPKEIRLVREKIKLEEQRAKKEVIEVTQNQKKYKLGVITIPVFYRDFEGARKREEGFASTTGDVQKFLNELKAEKVDGVVVDLRDNGGGSLTEAITLTGLFISRGPVVQVKEAQGDIEVQTDPDPSIIYDGPLAVMVNRFSASASEIFAAAIQDYKRGLIVGSQTYGKGTVQTMVDLNTWLKESEKVGQVKMTIAKFYRINGSSTQHKGVTPDIELPSAFSAEEYGESSQPSALPWDQIASARFDVTRSLDDKIITKIRERYEQRLKSDTDMKQLMADFAELKRAKEKTVVSLQESKRKKERDDAEKRRKSISASAGEPVATNDSTTPAKDPKDAKAPKKDLYLDECGKLLADYIAFTKNPQ